MTTTVPRRRYTIIAAMIAALTLVFGLACASAQPPPPQSLFGDTAPARPSDPENKKVEIGTRFTVAKDGLVTAIRFYKGGGNTGTHVGKLYAGNREVARVTFTGETETGWQTAQLNAPIAVKPGTTYTASYVAPRGKYASDEGYAWPKKSGDLTATGGFYRYPEGYPTQQWNRSNYYVDVLFAASVPAPIITTTQPPMTTTEPAPTTTTQPPATTDPTTTSPPPTTTQPAGCTGPLNTIGGPDPWGGCFPNVDNTGPISTPTIVINAPPNGDRFVVRDNGQVIENTVINNEMLVLAKDVVIRNSIINGRIDVDCRDIECSITIEDSEVHSGDSRTASVGFENLTIKRSEITGGTLAVACSNKCLIEDSYLHGQVLPPGPEHLGSLTSWGGPGDGITARHNTVWCEAKYDPASTGGCTSNFALFGTWGPTRNVLVERNLFPASESGYCTTWGQNIDPGKPYGDDVTFLRVVENVVGRDANGSCGAYGPDTSFKASEPSNEWRGNTWSDGAVWNHS